MSSSLTGNQGYRGPSGLSAGKKAAGYQQLSMPNFTPEQMDLFKHLFSNVGPDSYLSKLAGGDESAFQQTEAPALRQFSQLQGNLASRFSGMGMGARNSSGFQNAQNQAASDFAQDLMSRRMGLQRQALTDLSSLSNELLGQRPHEQFLVPQQKKKSVVDYLIGGGAPLVGAGVGGALGGLPGAQLGASLGSSFGQSYLSG